MLNQLQFQTYSKVLKQAIQNRTRQDINMPGKSGLECLEEIRNHKGGLKKVNIVMLSTSSDPENIHKARQMGAAFYAVKPSSFEKLKSLLRDILNMDLVSVMEAKRQFLFE